MATVPNRYYNSPIIKDVASNLTDALFGNPERENQQLQNKQLQDRMYRQATLDARADEDYTEKQQVPQFLSDIVAAQGDDSIDAAVVEGIKHHVPLNDAMLAAGTRSRKYLQQAGLADQRGELAQALLGQRLAELTARTGKLEEGRDRRLDTTLSHSDDAANAKFEHDKELLRLRGEQHINELNARIKSNALMHGNRNPLLIAGSVLLDIQTGIDNFEKNAGKTLTFEDKQDLIDKIGTDVQLTRNVPQSLTRILKLTLPQTDGAYPTREQPVEPGVVGSALSHLGYTPDQPQVLNPNFGSSDFSTAMNLQPANATPAAAATSTIGPKEGDTTKSKSGKPMVFRNGTWEYVQP